MSDAVAIQVGRISQKVDTLERRKKGTGTRKKSKKPARKKRTTLKKWKLVRLADPNKVTYQKLPKKGYMLIVSKNSIIRDTTENRAKYAAIPVTLPPGVTGGIPTPSESSMMRS